MQQSELHNLDPFLDSLIQNYQHQKQLHDAQQQELISYLIRKQQDFMAEIESLKNQLLSYQSSRVETTGQENINNNNIEDIQENNNQQKKGTGNKNQQIENDQTNTLLNLKQWLLKVRQVVQVDVENKKAVAENLRKTHEQSDILTKQMSEKKATLQQQQQYQHQQQQQEKYSIFQRAALSPTYLRGELNPIEEHDEGRESFISRGNKTSDQEIDLSHQMRERNYLENQPIKRNNNIISVLPVLQISPTDQAKHTQEDQSQVDDQQDKNVTDGISNQAAIHQSQKLEGSPNSPSYEAYMDSLMDQSSAYQLQLQPTPTYRASIRNTCLRRDATKYSPLAYNYGGDNSGMARRNSRLTTLKNDRLKARTTEYQTPQDTLKTSIREEMKNEGIEEILIDDQDINENQSPPFKRPYDQFSQEQEQKLRIQEQIKSPQQVPTALAQRQRAFSTIQGNSFRSNYLKSQNDATKDILIQDSTENKVPLTDDKAQSMIQNQLMQRRQTIQGHNNQSKTSGGTILNNTSDYWAQKVRSLINEHQTMVRTQTQQNKVLEQTLEENKKLKKELRDQKEKLDDIELHDQVKQYIEKMGGGSGVGIGRNNNAYSTMSNYEVYGAQRKYQDNLTNTSLNRNMLSHSPRQMSTTPVGGQTGFNMDRRRMMSMVPSLNSLQSSGLLRADTVAKNSASTYTLQEGKDNQSLNQ